MVDNFDALAKALAPNTGETAKTYTATVSYTDGEGAIWVRLPGAEEDTPTASTSAEVKMGDTVTVEWRNNKLYIAGNYTNPSAGVERVVKVDETAHVAKETAGEAQAAAEEAQTTANGAQTTATAALNAAQTTEQYFWHDSNGAHVTQVPKDDFILSPNGSNALLTSTGLEIRDGAERVLASFGARGARVGTEGQQSFVISPDGAEVYDSEGATTFHVGSNQVSVRKRMSTLNVPLPQVVGETVTFVLDPPADYDLGNLSFYVFVGANGGSTWTTNIDYYDAPAYAGPGGNQGSWEVVVTDTDPTTTVVVTCLRKDATQQADQDQCWIRYWGYGPAPTFEFGFENDVTGSGGFASGGNNTVTAAVAHAEGSFNTASGLAAHAEGSESTASALAAHAEGSNTEASAGSAHAEGVGTEASGVGAHAEGNNSVASGAYSHAEGSNTEASATASHAGGAGTIAQGPYQTVVGVYNTAEGDGSSSGSNHLLFIVGNGTDDNNRSNALTVDWNGNLVAGGHVSDGYGNVLGQGGGGGLTIDDIYPVGSIYMSVNSTNPGTLFAGTTWVQIEDTFLLAAGTNHAAGSTGGAETVTLTAAQSGLPAHTHSFTQPTVNGGAGTGAISGGAHGHTANYRSIYNGSSNYSAVSGAGGTSTTTGAIVNTSGSHTHNLPAHTHSVSGGAVGAVTGGAKAATSAHNNMPPYLAVYVWQRTA